MAFSSHSQSLRIASFAILDLETTNLPAYNFNKVSITELCIYGIAAENCKQNEGKSHSPADVPAMPRVVHKLSLLLNPMRMIDPYAEKITGLNNYILEKESSFNENAANTIVGFLEHLQRPTCLVAHNGLSFDFPILKYSFNKLNMMLPSDILCVDSLHAFRYIDKVNKVNSPVGTVELPNTVDYATENSDAVVLALDNTLPENNQKNWSSLNETTPKRSTWAFNAYPKRIKIDQNSPTEVQSKTRRALFADTKNTPRTLPSNSKKGMYQLSKMYERIFNQAPQQPHFAQSDVLMLTKLILYYGADFQQYAEDNAMPFAEVESLRA